MGLGVATPAHRGALLWLVTWHCHLPLIAAQMIMATLNTAYEMRRWAEVQSPEQAIKTYASIITRGLIPNR